MIVRILTIVGGLFLSAHLAYAAGEPEAFEDFALFQYIASTGLSPAYVMGLDSNGDLLLACREPKSIEQLRAEGLEFTASQVELLRAMRLLRKDGEGKWRTAIPLLSGDEAAELRSRATVLAEEITQTLQPEIAAFAEAVAQAGRAGHTYSLLYSYIFDGMVWGFLEEYRKVAPRRLSVWSPFWAGEVWGIHPRRTLVAATSTIAHSGVKLKVTHGERKPAALSALFADRTQIQSFLDQYLRDGRVTDTELRQRLTGYGLVDGAGELQIPVIDEVGRDALFRSAETLTERVVDLLTDKLNPAGLAEDLGLRDEAQAWVVAYHELMWEVMDRLRETGAVRAPNVLIDPERAESMEVAKAAFIVDRRKSSPADQDEPAQREDEERTAAEDGENG